MGKLQVGAWSFGEEMAIHILIIWIKFHDGDIFRKHLIHPEMKGEGEEVRKIFLHVDLAVVEIKS